MIFISSLLDSVSRLSGRSDAPNILPTVIKIAPTAPGLLKFLLSPFVLVDIARTWAKDNIKFCALVKYEEYMYRMGWSFCLWDVQGTRS